jgi:lipopolysaccharide biosynthesis glycosyltransferase
MIMNIPALRESKADLFPVVEGRLSITAPYDDQSAPNELFSGRWEHLPSTWNWKPYWGRNDEANIVHFHGPKPTHASQMLTGNLDSSEMTSVIFERVTGITSN